ncbi:MAG TPA: hypothetical protein PK402_11245, partial [Tepidisphaeraceae bacterium]|nr:hypothetical protein [Tepidisphaeraceae bacterium]
RITRISFVMALLLATVSIVIAREEPGMKVTWKLTEKAPAFLQKLIDQQPQILKQRAEMLEELIQYVEKKIEDLKASKPEKSSERAANIAKTRRLEKAVKMLEAMQTKSNSLLIPHEPPTAPEQFGTLMKFRVVKIIDVNEAIIEVHNTYNPLNADALRRYVNETEQPADDSATQPTTNPTTQHAPFLAAHIGSVTSRWKVDDVIELEAGQGFYVYCEKARSYQGETGEAVVIPELMRFSTSYFVSKLEPVKPPR